MSPNSIELIVLELIKGYKERDLQYAIDRGVSLASLVSDYLGGMLFIARLAGRIYKQQADLINYDSVMHWLKLERPDLYDVIDDRYLNKQWLKRQIDELKELIFG